MTRLDEAQTFYRPTYQHQGPDTNCTVTVNGHTYLLGWDSCTCYAGAMGEDGTTGGQYVPTGCLVRKRTGDVSGGTTLRQVADALMSLHGTYVATYTGSNVLSPGRVAQYLRAGQRVIVQGGAGAMVGTPYQSTAGEVNHAVLINEVRGGTSTNPSEALVYDPAADGRKRSYHVDQGPSWWPWPLVEKFAAYLRPAGDGTARLGPGKVYAGVFPDTEPHVTLVKGATKAHPFPDRVRAADPNDPTTAIHSSRGGVSTVSRHVPNGTLLRLYQYSGPWGGNDDGTEWVLLSNTSHVGGAT